MFKVPSCPICTGKRPFCIHKSYPFPGSDIEKSVKEKLKKDFFGPSYSVFVGKFGMPNVYAGPMVGLEEKKGLDQPDTWYGKSYSSIIEMRSLLLRSMQRQNVFSRSRFVQEMQELALASKPADVEIEFKKKPDYNLILSEYYQPMGPAGTLKKMKVTENVKIENRIEKIVNDELKATDSSFSLYNAGLNVYRISTIFSSGVLGTGEKKKLVPSRYSVTAIDDIIARKLMEWVRTYKSVNDFRVFESQYMDNRFVILVMPGNWEFENFEVWAPGSNWSKQTQSRIIEEYEPFKGRTSYAEKQAGGYYASRISAVRYLEQVKKQARVVAFREVYEGYVLPLGVWVVREVSERAFKTRPAVFQSRQEALEHISSRLRLPLSNYIKESKILSQKRINEF